MVVVVVVVVHYNWLYVEDILNIHHEITFSAVVQPQTFHGPVVWEFFLCLHSLMVILCSQSLPNRKMKTWYKQQKIAWNAIVCIAEDTTVFDISCWPWSRLFVCQCWCRCWPGSAFRADQQLSTPSYPQRYESKLAGRKCWAMCCIVENGSNWHHLATVMSIDRTQSKTALCHAVLLIDWVTPRQAKGHVIVTPHRAEGLRNATSSCVTLCRRTTWRRVDWSTCGHLRPTSGGQEVPHSLHHRAPGTGEPTPNTPSVLLA